MNCRQFQNQLYEYLEGSLSTEALAATDRHLEQCLSCRERAREEQEAARSLREGFQRATARLELPAAVGQRIAAALAAEHSAQRQTSAAARLWRRLAWPIAWATMVVVLLASWLAFVSGPWTRTAPHRTRLAEPAISIQLSIVTPIHTFRREGGVVIDAITYRTNTVSQRLQTELARLN